MKKDLPKPHSPAVRRLFLIMKLTFLINLLVLMQVSANVHSQPYITIQVKQVTFEEVLRKIEDQSNYHFIYRSDHLKGLPKVDLEAERLPIETILEKILMPNGLNFEISNDNIVIRKNAANQQKQVKIDEQITVSGKVTDENGDGLPGANILEKGTTNGTTTDSNGNFTITVDENAVLVFSFIGYLTQEISVNNLTVINVTMQPDVKSLEDVVVIGYGTVNKSDLTGSVSSLKPSDLNPGANASIDQMMLGRAAGVQISQASSEPGGGLSVRIRGASSVNASNEPLYVIDGFPIDNSSNLTGNGMSNDPNNPGSGFSLGSNFSPRNPLNSINPSDIESIEILKDASATAIYGSRGANGVVMITTKKGKTDKMTVNYNSYFGIQSIAKKVDVMSAPQYMQFMNDVSADQENGVVFTADQIAAIGEGTDWQKEIYQTAPISDNNISITGGAGNTKIFASLDYFDQEGILKNTGIKKYIGRLNFDSKVGKVVNIGFNINSSLVDDQNGTDGVNTNESAGPIYASINYDPSESIYGPDGTFSVSPFLTVNNPMSLVEGVKSTSKTVRNLLNFSIDYQIIEGLTAKLNMGVDVQNQRRDVHVSTLTLRGNPLKGSADITTLDRLSYLTEFTIAYDKTINSNHKFSLLGGTSFQKFEFRTFSGNISGFPSDDIQTNNLGLGDTNTDNLLSNKEENTLLSYMGRFNYTLYDKFLLTGSIRADGSSRFGENNKYGYFPSFAFGYKLSEEPFVPDFFEELKLRASWGQTGNQEIGNYASQLTFGTGPNVVLGGQILGSVQPLRIPNPDLKWETTTQTNIGIDASMLKGKISVTLDYFLKRTTDMLFNLPLPVSSGYSYILTNVGEVKNNGFEFMINSNNVTTDKFSWSTSLNLTTIKNEVVDLGRVDQIVTGNVQAVGNTAIIKVGHPLASYYGYEVIGIQRAGDPKPGFPKFKDQTGEGSITPDDQVIIGNPYPDFTWGLNNTLKHKNIALTFFFQAVQGADLLNINVLESMYPPNFRRNRLATMLDRWTPSNADAAWPSAVDPNSYGGSKVNSMVLQDASYWRLKNVQLSYQVPTARISFLSSLKVYVTGQNLFTVTDYIGFDPEANSFGRNNVKLDYSSYPLARVYTLGFNATF